MAGIYSERIVIDLAAQRSKFPEKGRCTMKLKILHTALFSFAGYCLFRSESWAFPSNLPDIDKIAHFALFLSLSCSSYFVFRSTHPAYYQVPLILFALISETYQGAFLPDRQFSLGDLSANCLGIFIGFLCCLKLRERNWRLSW